MSVLLLVARHLAHERRGQLKRLIGERGPAKARHDRRIEDASRAVVKVLLDRARVALGLGDILEHHLTLRECGLAEALLEQL